jgi:hypothetical protein
VEAERGENVKTIRTIVTAREDTTLPSGTTVTSGVPGQTVILQMMAPWAQVLVRFVRSYLQGLVGFLLLALAAKPTLAGLGVVIPPGDFLSALEVAAGLALAPSVVSLLQNTIELLGKLDEKFPKLRA